MKRNHRAERLLVILGAVEKAMEKANRENNTELYLYWTEKYVFFVEKYEEALAEEV